MVILVIQKTYENQDAKYFYPIRNTIEAFGFPHETSVGKQYLFGKLIVADAFIVWCNASNYEFKNATAAEFWQWKFVLGSLIVAFLCFFLFINSNKNTLKKVIILFKN